MSLVQEGTEQNWNLWTVRQMLTIMQCVSSLCNISLTEVVTWHVRYTTCFVRSGFVMLEKYMELQENCKFSGSHEWFLLS